VLSLLAHIYHSLGETQEALRLAHQLAEKKGGEDGSLDLDKLNELLSVFEQIAEDYISENRDTIEKNINSLSEISLESSIEEAVEEDTDSVLFEDIPGLEPETVPIIDIGGIDPVIAINEEEETLNLLEMEEEIPPEMPSEKEKEEEIHEIVRETEKSSTSEAPFSPTPGQQATAQPYASPSGQPSPFQQAEPPPQQQATARPQAHPPGWFPPSMQAHAEPQSYPPGQPPPGQPPEPPPRSYTAPGQPQYVRPSTQQQPSQYGYRDEATRPAQQAQPYYLSPGREETRKGTSPETPPAGEAESREQRHGQAGFTPEERAPYMEHEISPAESEEEDELYPIEEARAIQDLLPEYSPEDFPPTVEGLLGYLKSLTRYLPDKERNSFLKSGMILKIESIRSKLRGLTGLSRKIKPEDMVVEKPETLDIETFKKTCNYLENLSDYHPEREIGFTMKNRIESILRKIEQKRMV